MRITYFTDTFRIGGAERFLADLAAGVTNAGHEVTVVSPQTSVLELIAGEVPAARVIRSRPDVWARTSRRARMAAFAHAVPELLVVLRRTRPHLLHFNNGGYPGSELCRAATVSARFAGARKRVLTVHSTPWQRAVSPPHLHAIADGLVWRSVDAVHVGTAFAAKRLGELRGMPPALGRHIPYGVREPLGTSDAVTTLRARFAPGTGILVGMISATGEVEKGHAVFADALARARPDIHALIVGAHPGDEFDQQLAQAGLAERVALVGRVPSAEFGAHLRAIDLLVVPSTAYESLPLVVLEAMAAGKPVFASRLSGIPEAVGDGETGRLFTPCAAGELATMLDEAASDPGKLAQMGEAAHDRWKTMFSVTRMTTSMLELYEELTGGRRSEPA
jgi:glycosyltransferase involved in cell wall biosynthesis